MSNSTKFYIAVDSIWKNTKALVGQAEWTQGYGSDGARWLSPLAIDGVTTGMNLCIDSFPRAPVLRFSISLIYETSICRLDFWKNDRHLNHAVKGVRTPPNIQLGWLFGSHLHSWEDNKMLINSDYGPKELEFAVPIPERVKSFDAAFRYFCDVANIIVPTSEMPNLPRRDTLL